MCSLDGIIQDIVHKRGKVEKKDGESGQLEYTSVWTALVRYVQACLEQRRGLHITNFCKIGWQLEKKRQGGKAVYRPFFQFAEQFCRSYLSQEASRKNVAPQNAELCPFEDFNFSKAAIKFSQNLTKDQVFVGVRSLVQRIGEVIAENKEVDITIDDVGRLICRGDRDPRFQFAPELYIREGIEAPLAVADEGVTQKTSASFRRGGNEEALSLGIQGSSKPGPLTTVQEEQFEPQPSAFEPEAMPPVTNTQDFERYIRHEPPAMAQDFVDYSSEPPRRLMSGGSAMSMVSQTPSLTNTQYKKEVAYKEAMDRHISAMEARASEAMFEREAWSQHVHACQEQERDEIQQKRLKAQMNLNFLQHQIKIGEEKKKEQRKEDIVAASAHDFPQLSLLTDEDRKTFFHGQQARMRADLDDQVRTNHTLRNLAKQRERTIEVNQLESNKREMAMLRNAERAKKAYDREALATAWNSEIRMKNIWKAIESHNKVGSHPPQVLLTDSLPPSRGSSAMTAGRLLTGSSRRVPLGASNSMGQLEVRLGSARPVM